MQSLNSNLQDKCNSSVYKHATQKDFCFLVQQCMMFESMLQVGLTYFYISKSTMINGKSQCLMAASFCVPETVWACRSLMTGEWGSESLILCKCSFIFISFYFNSFPWTFSASYRRRNMEDMLGISEQCVQTQEAHFATQHEDRLPERQAWIHQKN